MPWHRVRTGVLREGVEVWQSPCMVCVTLAAATSSLRINLYHFMSVNNYMNAVVYRKKGLHDS